MVKATEIDTNSMDGGKPPEKPTWRKLLFIILGTLLAAVILFVLGIAFSIQWWY